VAIFRSHAGEKKRRKKDAKVARSLKELGKEGPAPMEGEE